jgi:hypothetical protein
LPPELWPVGRQEMGACRLLREDRTSTRLGSRPHIVPPGKRVQVGIRNRMLTGPLSGLFTNHIVPPGKGYRPLREICGHAVSSGSGKYIVLPGKRYRPTGEEITPAPGRDIVPFGKTYRPLGENLSSCPGTTLDVLPANSRFSVRASIARSVFVYVKCLLCVL